MLMGWMVGASTKAGKAGSVHAIKVSLGSDSPVVTMAGASLLQSSPPSSSQVKAGSEEVDDMAVV